MWVLWTGPLALSPLKLASEAYSFPVLLWLEVLWGIHESLPIKDIFSTPDLTSNKPHILISTQLTLLLSELVLIGKKKWLFYWPLNPTVIPEPPILCGSYTVLHHYPMYVCVSFTLTATFSSPFPLFLKLCLFLYCPIWYSRSQFGEEIYANVLNT